VVVLSVDDGGVAIPGIALDSLPDVQHRAAGGIHQHASHGAETLEISDRHPKGRHDHHIVRRHRPEIELAVGAMGQQRDPHMPELLVDMGVVDDLTDQEEPPIRKLGSGLVRVLDRAIHSVAEAKLPRQPEGQSTCLEAVLVGPHRLDHRTVVIGVQPARDLVLEAKALPEVGVLHAVNVVGCRSAEHLHRDASSAGRNLEPGDGS